MISSGKIRTRYILTDLLTAALAWLLFFYYRKNVIETAKFGYHIPFEINDRNFILGLIFVPVYWITLYYLTGQYKEPVLRSRLREMVQVFNVSFIGVLLLFFALLLDDTVRDYRDYYKSFLILFALHFLLTELARYTISSRVKKLIQQGKIVFNTLIIGCDDSALNIYRELSQRKKSEGYAFKGYVQVSANDKDALKGVLPNLGTAQELQHIAELHRISDVIIAIDTKEHRVLEELLNKLAGRKIKIRIIPDMYDILSGNVKMNYILGPAIIELKTDTMPAWQQSVKRFLDVAFSLIVLIVGFPVFLAIALAVKLSSPGPAFYMQERVGLHGRSFRIIKFRSMRINAEAAGPMLSSENDPRITRIGKFLRKTRLDEIPQFFNVLIGEMSLVGPRPERQFFIDQIVQVAPQYKHLHRVKPGITSWGQVKYGYAENVSQMVERLKFDLIYIENMSLAVDFRIMVYTVLIMMQGRGK